MLPLCRRFWAPSASSSWASARSSARHLRPDGHGRGTLCRTRRHPVFRAGRNGVRLRGTLLCRAGGAHARGRQHLHLHLCQPRTAGRLARRVEISFWSIRSVRLRWRWDGRVYFNGTLASIGLAIPPQFSASTGQAVQLADGTTVDGDRQPARAAAIVAVLTLLLVRGTRESGARQQSHGGDQADRHPGIHRLRDRHVSVANWQPFVPPNAGTFGTFGWSRLSCTGPRSSSSPISASTPSRTVRRKRNQPQRDMPIGILGRARDLDDSLHPRGGGTGRRRPLSRAERGGPGRTRGRSHGHRLVRRLIQLGALIGITTAMLVLLYGQGRIFATMANDGLMAADVQPRPSRLKNPMDESDHDRRSGRGESPPWRRSRR